MDLDLETFLTTLYVMVDDLYQTHVRPTMPACGGPPPALSDSEVLCLGLAAQWRSGVPWKSERGFLRYAHKHLRPLFPGLTTQSAFNRRLRRLWGRSSCSKTRSPRNWCRPPISRSSTASQCQWPGAPAPSIRVGCPTSPASARGAMIATSTACTCCCW